MAADPSFGLNGRGLEDVLAEASAQGVIKVVCVASLLGGYSESGERQHWSCTAQKRDGAHGKTVGSARGSTHDEAVMGALRALDVIG